MSQDALSAAKSRQWRRPARSSLKRWRERRRVSVPTRGVFTVIDHTLSKGQHRTRESGMCAMELVAYLAGEEHSDRPECVDPALRRFVTGLNDTLLDDLRQQLWPYLARMIGTAHDGRTQERLYLIADWAVRVLAPEALEAAGYKEHANNLRAVEPVVDEATASAAERAARAAHTTSNERAACAYALYAASASTGGPDGGINPPPEATVVKLLPSALELLDRMLPAMAGSG